MRLAIIPLLPLLAAAITALLPRTARRTAATLVIGAQAFAFLAALAAFASILPALAAEGSPREFVNFPWLSTGAFTLRLGLLLDPLSGGMGLMVSFVSLLIFIYSHGYMKEDGNYVRFFCFLSLFSAAMLGVVYSNSLLLTFICWELVGLASYLLIGFWFQKPEAAAAAKKAFLTTRIGDMGLFAGILWLSASSGSLLFYDGGPGCLEAKSLASLSTTVVCGGLALSNMIAILIFCGAAGKSGQFPLHVWLPDAMEGPTPVSALIHAATMVAAGVFLVARMFPLFSATGLTSAALVTVAWTGAVTALLGALIAVAQTDIKRILAYSTVSQLGFMMLALGVGSVSAAMVHLIAHAFFKALLFLGAGSVIHGLHGEQDIRNMGGLRKFLPITFATYAVGMMALTGVPFFFSGFWSKDEILHVVHGWPVSSVPFFLAAGAAFLTAYYMMRQTCLVFAGTYRGKAHPHESPLSMTAPLVVLGAFAIGLSLLATPAWPWLHSFHGGEVAAWNPAKLLEHGFVTTAGLSILLTTLGLGLGYVLFGAGRGVRDPLQKLLPGAFRALENRLWFDELYDRTVLRAFRCLACLADAIERFVFLAAVRGVETTGRIAAKTASGLDRFGIDLGFDSLCGGLRDAGDVFSSFECGKVRRYLRTVAVGVTLLLAVLAWMLK